MRSTLKFLGALIVALILMLAFRALAFTIYTVPCEGFEPTFLQGDRVMVNRWSYGLRTGGEGLFAYARILRSPVSRGDLVAIDDSLDHVIICRCTAVPGDSIKHELTSTSTQGIAAANSSLFTLHSSLTLVPGVINCADQDYYAMQPLTQGLAAADSSLFTLHSSLIPEERIIGRVCLIVYNHADSLPFWRGYHPDRWMLCP